MRGTGRTTWRLSTAAVDNVAYWADFAASPALRREVLGCARFQVERQRGFARLETDWHSGTRLAYLEEVCTLERQLARLR
jgi:hypothetical protein